MLRPPSFNIEDFTLNTLYSRSYMGCLPLGYLRYVAALPVPFFAGKSIFLVFSFLPGCHNRHEVFIFGTSRIMICTAAIHFPVEVGRQQNSCFVGLSL